MKRIFKKNHIGLFVCVNNDVWPMPWDFKDIDIDWRWWIARQQLTCAPSPSIHNFVETITSSKIEHDFNKFKHQYELNDS
jgi:hypothetical protein